MYLSHLNVTDDCTMMIIWDIVDFSSRNLQLFNSEQLRSLRMRHLLLNSNDIRLIADRTFDSIADILFGLDLSINSIVNISSEWLNSKFIQLKMLNMAFNQIQSLSNLDRIQFPWLQILNLSRNQIDQFPSQIRQWTSLITLDLSFNRLMNIPRFALTGLHNLTWLSLAGNQNLTCKSSVIESMTDL